MKRKVIQMMMTACLAATVVPAGAALIPISTCNPAAAAPVGSLINAAGNYQVVANLTQGGTADCILITASNVSLALNGHLITGVNNGNAGIEANNSSSRLNHVVIQGPGLITGFQNGVSFSSVDYGQISQVTAARNSTVGIAGTDVTFLTVGANTLVLNGATGLDLYGSFNATIQYNKTNANGINVSGSFIFVAGIFLVNGGANSLNNNTATGNGTSGYAFSGGMVIQENNDRISGNSTDGNFGYGILIIEGVGGNQIFNNPSSVGNLVDDMFDGNPGCGTNTWSDNTFFTSNMVACVH